MNERRDVIPHGVRHGTTADTTESDTIENVASNFMKHVQKTEEDNRKLQQVNNDLESQLKSLSDRERHLVAENDTIKGELTELTGHHQKLKDENSALIKKFSDLKREKEALKKVHEDQTQHMESTIKELTDSKAKLNHKLEDMVSNMQEFNVKMEKQATVIAELRRQVEDKENTKKLDTVADNKKLKKEINEKKELIETLTKELNHVNSENKVIEHTEVGEIHRLKDLVKKQEREIKSKNDMISPLEKERSFLSGELSKVKEEVKQKVKEIDELKRKMEALVSSKKAMEKTTQNLKSENRSLKDQHNTSHSDLEDHVELLEAERNELQNKVQLMRTSEMSMAELLKGKESHILDLRSEITELRNVCNLFQRDLETYKDVKSEKNLLIDKYEDMVINHKRILDENKRLRTMFATKSIEETNNVSERKELEGRLDSSQRHLLSAQHRIAQLEDWMDQIFKNQDFDIILKNGTPRDSVVSLPDISTTPSNNKVKRLHRKKGPPIRRYTQGSFKEFPGKQ